MHFNLEVYRLLNSDFISHLLQYVLMHPVNSESCSSLF